MAHHKWLGLELWKQHKVLIICALLRISKEIDISGFDGASLVIRKKSKGKSPQDRSQMLD